MDVGKLLNKLHIDGRVAVNTVNATHDGCQHYIVLPVVVVQEVIKLYI